MAALTRKEVEEIALLARLALTDDELDRMADELGTILGHFAAIAAADTHGVPPMTHAVPTDLRLRVDAVEPSLPAEVALAATAKRDGDLFSVPSSIAPPAPPGPAGGEGGAA
jgi:aspartyl-tRNA(Asn)/glutamyl-tRNA(Gln) amidotransferase subunit C